MPTPHEKKEIMKIVKKLRFSVNENWGGGIIIAHQTNLKKKNSKLSFVSSSRFDFGPLAFMLPGIFQSSS